MRQKPLCFPGPVVKWRLVCRRRYWQVLQDLANGPLVSTNANPMVDARYNAMVANGRTIDNPSSIKSYISQSRNYLLGLITTNVPANFSISSNGGVDFSTSVGLLALAGTAPIDVRFIAINGVTYPVTWTSVSNWTAAVALSGGTNTLTVQGLDARKNPISGATATIHVNYTGPVEQPRDKLVVNEIMYNPLLPNTSFIEIYNRSIYDPFDLSSMRLDGADFTFPGGSVIGPNGFAVVAEDRVAFAAAYGGTIPVYRVWDDRVDTNHRYTTSLQIQQQMKAAGWIPEGYGPAMVIMCSPQ